MRPVKILRCGAHAFIAASMLLAPAVASSAETGWKAECVGRYQMSLPGEVEVAVNRFDIPKRGSSTYTRFSNGDAAEKSDSLHLGSVSISSEVPISVFYERVKKIEASRLKRQQEEADSDLESGRILAEKEKKMQFSMDNVTGWRSQAENGTFAIRMDMYAANRLVFHQASRIDTAAEADEAAQIFVRNFSPRPLYTLPKGEGVCIPYGFIADDGKPGRHVAVTMRLVEHPDVEIFFKDQNGPRPYKTGAALPNKTGVSLPDSKRLNFIFLSLEALKTNGIKVLFPGYRTTKLGGYPGTASFFEIKRKDGTRDYGYAVHVAGDYTADTDMPHLMLYVIRTASRAKGKPVSKNELKDIAIKIAASVKRREVK